MELWAKILYIRKISLSYVIRGVKPLFELKIMLMFSRWTLHGCPALLLRVMNASIDVHLSIMNRMLSFTHVMTTEYGRLLWRYMTCENILSQRSQAESALGIKDELN